MKLYTLFISYSSSGHYCSVYPSLEHVHDVIEEMMCDMKIPKKEIPLLNLIEAYLESHDDFWYEFSDSTWIHVNEVSEQLVSVIKEANCSQCKARLLS